MQARLHRLLSHSNEHRLLGFMLVILHFALWSPMGDALARSLVLAHLGLFLVWQPMWRRDEKLSPINIAVFLVGTILAITWLNWWLMAFWLLVLTGLVGGRMTANRTERYAYMIALLFLVSELLIGCIPPMFQVSSLPPEISEMFRTGLVALPVGLMLFPAGAERAPGAGNLDFLYGLTMTMLVSIIALGSLLSMYTTGTPYAVALFQTVLGIALVLLAISWLWMPFAGFSGLGQLWERYLLNIGTPFEQWLGRLAELAGRRQTPEQFLDAAVHQLVELPWVAGVSWEAPAGRGAYGERTGFSFNVGSDDLRLHIFAYRPIGTGLVLHGKLLVGLLVHFHHAKEREMELTRQAHVQAIYETGARVTHDIKNLLQSLRTMTVAVEACGPERRAEAQQLIEKHLPHLSERLQLALDKLQTPEKAPAREMPASRWWAALETRNVQRGIRFEAHLAEDPSVPAECFDSVAENLLENARIKRLTEPGLVIAVRLACESGQVRLTVEDDGAPLDAELARGLFAGPVRSRSGLGIGLYQSARQAAQAGYRLSLEENAPGRVRFALTGRERRVRAEPPERRAPTRNDAPPPWNEASPSPPGRGRG